MRRHPTRRELVAVAAAGTVAGAGAGLAIVADPSAAATPPPMTTPEALSNALLAERLLVLAYRRVLASGILPLALQRTATGFLAHEIEHVSTVARRLAELGVAASTGPLDLASAEPLLAKHHVKGSLTNLPTKWGQCVILLVDLESVAEGAYFNAMRDLTSPSLIRLSAQIMSCEAQHWTVLMTALNPGQVVKAVPWPFVLGTR
jgi:hypothetical protein